MVTSGCQPILDSSDTESDVDIESNCDKKPTVKKHKYMPLTNYHGMQLPKLRQACKELGIRIGTRNEMIFRHKEYTLQYNVQCDGQNTEIDTKQILKIVRQKEIALQRSKQKK